MFTPADERDTLPNVSENHFLTFAVLLDDGLLLPSSALPASISTFRISSFARVEHS